MKWTSSRARCSFLLLFLDDIIQKLAWLLLLQSPKQIKVQNGNLSLVLYSLEVRAMTRCNWVPGQHERPRRGSKKVWHHSFFASNYWRYASLVTLPTIEPISQHRRDWKTREWNGEWDGEWNGTEKPLSTITVKADSKNAFCARTHQS